MTSFAEGQYVRCPTDREYPDRARAREFLLGQIRQLHEMENTAEIVFHDPEHLTRFYGDLDLSTRPFSISQIERCSLLNGSRVTELRGKRRGTVLAHAGQSSDGFSQYFVTWEDRAGQVSTGKVGENQLAVSCLRGDASPLTQMLQYEFHKPFWYLKRKQMAKPMHVIRNAVHGLDTLIGSRVLLLPHQMDAIVRAIGEDPCRFMLADEVGMGKTIEAAVIMKALQNRIADMRTLILAPESLVGQWRSELNSKFWMETPAWSKSTASSPTLVMPLERIAEAKGRRILSQSWDLCIVDETHRLLRMPDHYEEILELSRRTKHVLLLSATPIHKRKTEYLRLLTLLDPALYGKMSKERFEALLDKQGVVRELVYRLVRDLGDYVEYDLSSRYLGQLSEACGILQDDNLRALVRSVDQSAEDKGLATVKLILAYMSENYQIDRHVFRHRRAELRDSMPTRRVMKEEYVPGGIESGDYEAEIYGQVINYLEWLADSAPQLDEATVDHMQAVMSSTLSSPWALRQVMIERARQVDSPEEKTKISTICMGLERWERVVDREMANIRGAMDDPETMKGRLARLCYYVDESLDSEKLVVFSSWTETAHAAKCFLSDLLGPNAVVGFLHGMEQSELDDAADRFQSDPGCRVMVCDSLGGEGRNFQIASALIHLDMPWSPVELEQRIGRLDRIGRSDEVLSVVITAAETVDEQLYKLWADIVGVFTESLSGLEIALEDINAVIRRHFARTPRYGIQEAGQEIAVSIDSMRRAVEEERYYDVARSFDSGIEEQLRSLAERFTSQGGSELGKAMLSWATASGMDPIGDGVVLEFSERHFHRNAMRNALLVPPNMAEALKRGRRKTSKYQSSVLRGTFDRAQAVVREDLVFFAPGEELFHSLARSAEESDRGRCCAYAVPSFIDADWMGFIFTWSVTPDPTHLLEAGGDPRQMSAVQGYGPLDPVVIVEGVDQRTQKLAEKLHLELLMPGETAHSTCHLGQRHADNGSFFRLPLKRGLTTLEWFKHTFPPDRWHPIVEKAYDRAFHRAIEQASYQCRADQLRVDLERKLNGIVASDLYYGNPDRSAEKRAQRQRTINEALVRSLDPPLVTLDSAAVVLMVNQNG